jgi:hypothetical protein
MSYTNGLDKPTDYFNTVLYTGDGTSSNAITGVGFQPDWVWIKERNNSRQHQQMDIVRGASVRLQCSTTNAESSSALNSFDSDGFTVNGSTLNGTNFNTGTYASWNWLASNSTASNTDGTITSTVSANQTAGFSIVSYTGTGSLATVGHGLGIAPSWIFGIDRTNGGNWFGYHKSLSATDNIQLNQTSASSDNATFYNDTEPTSSVFTINTNSDINTSSANIIAYCFAEKKGYSKFGSYTGNGNADGPFVYTGFKPAWVMFKPAGESADWTIVDNKRNTFNVVKDKTLNANLSSAEHDGSMDTDFLSNGFKIRNANTDNNSSNAPGIIYMAFAESPFVTGASAIPTTAR